MQNPEFVINSPEKLETHKRINSLFFPWIEFHFQIGGKVVTMPASSGRQENQILDHIINLERATGLMSQVALLTFDDTNAAENTGIDPSTPDRLWKHWLCKDIFDKLVSLNIPEQPMAVWFDLTGGLSEHNKAGMLRCVALFAHGSLLYVTLQIHVYRSLGKDSRTKEVYDQCAQTAFAKEIITDRLIKDLISSSGTKHVREVGEPYVYKHGHSTYAVFGYIVIKNDHS